MVAKFRAIFQFRVGGRVTDCGDGDVMHSASLALGPLQRSKFLLAPAPATPKSNDAPCILHGGTESITNEALIKKLKALGCTVAGNRAELINRLTAAVRGAATTDLLRLIGDHKITYSVEDRNATGLCWELSMSDSPDNTQCNAACNLLKEAEDFLTGVVQVLEKFVEARQSFATKKPGNGSKPIDDASCNAVSDYSDIVKFFDHDNYAGGSNSQNSQSFAKLLGLVQQKVAAIKDHYAIAKATNTIGSIAPWLGYDLLAAISCRLAGKKHLAYFSVQTPETPEMLVRWKFNLTHDTAVKVFVGSDGRAVFAEKRADEVEKTARMLSWNQVPDTSKFDPDKQILLLHVGKNHFKRIRVPQQRRGGRGTKPFPSFTASFSTNCSNGRTAVQARGAGAGAAAATEPTAVESEAG
eukprot:gene10157-14633_t